MDLQPDLPFFTEEASAEAVNARIAPDRAGERIGQVVAALTRHLHAFVKEVEPTHEEWLAGIAFLTRTGHMCTEWRQEFILLSDVLGVSSLVDAINSRRPSGATENTILGPFYVKDPPQRQNGDTICLDAKGAPTLVHGRVRDATGRPIAGAIVDVWQTNADGFYDVQQRGTQPEHNMRGAFRTDAEGRYRFRTTRPRDYPIPGDGPTGELLDGLGRGNRRAAHIHAIVSADGFDTVITHIFDPECAYLHEDAVFGVKDSLVKPFLRVDDPERARAERFEAAPFWEVEADFTLVPATGRTALIHQV